MRKILLRFTITFSHTVPRKNKPFEGLAPFIHPYFSFSPSVRLRDKGPLITVITLGNSIKRLPPITTPLILTYPCFRTNRRLSRSPARRKDGFTILQVRCLHSVCVFESTDFPFQVIYAVPSTAKRKKFVCSKIHLPLFVCPRRSYRKTGKYKFGKSETSSVHFFISAILLSQNLQFLM